MNIIELSSLARNKDYLGNFILFLTENDSKTEEEFEDDSDIEDDSEEEEEVEELNYVCPILICNEKFHGYDDLMEHVQENHPRRRRKSRKPRDESNLTPHQIKMRLLS